MQDLFIRTGELLLPSAGVDPTAWACVACDQYTSQPQYWREAAALVGDRPSALQLILPEAMLDEAGTRIPDIHRAMRDALAQGTLTPGVKDGFILTERATDAGKRLGIVALMDLDGYDYRAGSQTLVRATEGTIVERIPPRVAVRRGAALELSHVLLLMDDPLMRVVEPLYARRDRLTLLYDFPLMMGGGHLRGYAVTDPADVEGVFAALRALKERQSDGLLFAVGDGNHSLAAAKAFWEEIRPSLSPAGQADHPARLAMVELENIHDGALVFEPIHRVLCGADGDVLLAEMAAYARRKGWTLATSDGGQPIRVAFGGKAAVLSVGGSPFPLAVGTLQAFLDDWLPDHPGASLDYVHGDDTALSLADAPDTVAFLLPALDKAELFPLVARLGALPRKTFSMGEAHEKRYYMEARRLER